MNGIWNNIKSPWIASWGAEQDSKEENGILFVEW